MKRLDRWTERNFTKLYILLIAGAVCMYGVFSLDSLVWADEAYTFALIRHSIPEIWKITAADVHPPLYYFLLKLVAAPFDYHLAVCRFVSAIPCILVVAVGGWQIRKLFGTRTAVLFMALYLLFPYTMSHATEVRMYSLAELLVLLNAIYGYRCWKDNRAKDWALFALFGTCAAYTHYFALMSAGMVYGILLIAAVWKKRELLKGWAIASAGTVVLFLPWLGSFVSQLIYKVNNEYWIEPITLGDIVDYVLTVFSSRAWTSAPLFLGLAYAVAFAALLLSRNKSRIGVCLCALAVPLGTVAVGLLASVLVRPVFVIRYILPSVPLAVFFFAYVLGNLKEEMLFSALLTVALIGGVSNAMVTAKEALIPASDRISSQLVSELPECDAYVVVSGNTLHASQELSYYNPEIPIYVPDALGPDNPYPNRVAMDTFRAEENRNILLVVQTGDGIPEEFTGQYSAQLLYSVKVSGTPEDLWYLQAIE